MCSKVSKSIFVVLIILVVTLRVARAELVFESGESMSGDMNITSEQGLLRGNNLLHSFQLFNINATESATFSGPANVQNIIARISGLSTTLIDGTLRSSISNADLFLLNPNGIMFGPGASIDVNGSLYVSTAPRLLFDDGSSLVVSASSNSTLTAASPAAFGFDANPSPITFDGVDISGDASAKGLSIVGGDISLQDTTIFLPGSSIDLVAVKEAMDVPLAPEDRSVSQGLGNFEQITSLLETSGDPAGFITISADTVTMSDSAFIFSDTRGPAKGEGIRVQATSSLTLEGGSRITTDALVSDGAGGDISIQTAVLSLRDANTKIASDTQRSGGDSGALSIQAEMLIISDGAQVSSRSASGGNGGDILIEVGSLELNNGGLISGQTVGDGKGADVTIKADKSVVINGHAGSATGISVSSLNLAFFSFGKNGDAGDVNIITPLLTLNNGGKITAESVTPDSGAPGTITLNLDELVLSGGSFISTKTASSSDGGPITINTDSLHMLGAGSSISSSTSRNASGGDIIVNARDILLQDVAAIDANSTGAGFAGNISLSAAGSVSVLNQSRIKTSSAISGGGNISVNAIDKIYLHNSGLTASAQGQGPADNGGNISIDPVFLILSGSSIVAKAFSGNGGIIELEAENFISDISSVIDASSELGNDGEVRISSPDNGIAALVGTLNADLGTDQVLLKDTCATRVLEDRSSLIVLKKKFQLRVPGDITETLSQTGSSRDLCSVAWAQ